MSKTTPLFPSLAHQFSFASDGKDKKKQKRSFPLTVRVTQKEKDQLTEAAGALALSAYVRQKLFGDMEALRPQRYRKKQNEPSIDTVELARLLGMFGQSELATSMLALSLAATQGHMDVAPEIEDKIDSACEDIETIKMALILALNVKPQGGPSA